MTKADLITATYIHEIDVDRGVVAHLKICCDLGLSFEIMGEDDGVL